MSQPDKNENKLEKVSNILHSDDHFNNRKATKPSILFNKPIDKEKTQDFGKLSRLNNDRLLGTNNEVDMSSKCKFNGYSNKEITIMFLIALMTSLLFFFDKSQYLYNVCYLSNYHLLNRI